MDSVIQGAHLRHTVRGGREHELDIVLLLTRGALEIQFLLRLFEQEQRSSGSQLSDDLRLVIDDRIQRNRVRRNGI